MNSKVEADIRYSELVDEYMSLTDSGKMTEDVEMKFFNNLEDLVHYISIETKNSCSDKLDNWLRAKR